MIVPLNDRNGTYRGYLAGDTIYSRDGRAIGMIRDGWVYDNRDRRVGQLRGQTLVAIDRSSQPPSGLWKRIRSSISDRLGAFTIKIDPFDQLETPN